MKRLYPLLALALLALAFIATTMARAADKIMVSGVIAAGDTIANTTTKTRFSTVFNMPPTATGTTVTGPSELRKGQAFAVDLFGVMSTSASPGTLTFTIDHGNGASGTVLTPLGSTGAITVPASLSNAGWTVHGTVVYNTTGQDVGIATFSGYMMVIKADNTPTIYPMTANISGTAGMATGLDTTRTVFNILGGAAQWSVTGNSITQSAGSNIRRIS